MKKLNLEVILRRSITLVIFIVILFSLIILIELFLYSMRFFLYGINFPKNPYSFEFLKRMWY